MDNLQLQLRREVRREAVRIIQHAGETKQSSPEEIVIKLLQLLQKNSPRSISDSTKLIETYMNYLTRLIGADGKEVQQLNEKKITSVLGTSPLSRTALKYNYNVKEISVNQDLAKLAVRVLSTFMRNVNMLNASEIASAYQNIYSAILNSVVPRYI